MGFEKKFIFRVENGGAAPVPAKGSYNFVTYGDEPTIYAVDYKGIKHSTTDKGEVESLIALENEIYQGDIIFYVEADGYKNNDE